MEKTPDKTKISSSVSSGRESMQTEYMASFSDPRFYEYRECSLPDESDESDSSTESYECPLGKGEKKNDVLILNTNRYKLLEIIGKGSISEVYNAMDTTGQYFAIKCINLRSFDHAMRIRALREVEFLHKLKDCERVAKLHGCCLVDGIIYIIMEKGHDFPSYLHNQKMPLDKAIIEHWCRDMIWCVKDLHDHKFVHGDLKPWNLIVVNEKLKIIDFGEAVKMRAGKHRILRETQCGTMDFVPPEALQSCYANEGGRCQYEVGYSTDIWSVGCIIYTMIYANPPFHKFKVGPEKMKAIVDESLAIDYPEVNVDSNLLTIMKACLRRKVDQRATLQEILKNPFMKTSGGGKHSGVPTV